MSARSPYSTPLAKIEKPQWPSKYTTPEDVIKRMGGNVSPGARRAIEMLYRPDVVKALDDLVDATNDLFENDARQWRKLDEMTVQLDEIREGIDEEEKFNEDFRQQLARIEKTAEQIKRSMDWEWKYC